jgi:hypothetical protein
MVNFKKVVKKGGKALGETTSIFKKYARKAIKVGGKALSKTIEIAGDSLKKIKNKVKKLTKAQAVVLLTLGGVATYSGVNIGDAVAEFNKRNNKEFTVKEIFYKDGDDVDEISFVITNPDKIEIYPDDSFVIVEANSFFDSKFSNKTLILGELPYLITETKISKDKENDEQPDLNPDIPYVITIKINGLDLSGKDKDMIKSGEQFERLFVLKLKPDINNDIKDEFEDDGEAIKESLENAVKAIKESLENAVKAGAGATDDFLKWILEQLKTLLVPVGYTIGYVLLAILIIYILYLIGKTVILNFLQKK